MTTALFATILLIVILAALEHNHTRSLTGLAGSTDVEDRDVARTLADLRYAPPAEPGAARVTGARTAATVRPASAIR